MPTSEPDKILQNLRKKLQELDSYTEKHLFLEDLIKKCKYCIEHGTHPHPDETGVEFIIGYNEIAEKELSRANLLLNELEQTQPQPESDMPESNKPVSEEKPLLTWAGSEREFIALFSLLEEKGLITGFSNANDEKQWELIATLFLNKGNAPFKAKQLASVYQQIDLIKYKQSLIEKLNT